MFKKLKSPLFMMIVMILTGLVLVLTGCGEKIPTSKKEIGYQRARAEKVGKYVAENFADKKILILTVGDLKNSRGEVVPNHMLESLKKGLGGVGYEVLARPVPDEGMDECFPEIEWSMKYLDNLMMGKDYKGGNIPGYSPVGDFDLLITTIDLPEDAFHDGGFIGSLAGKSVAFVQGYTERWAAGFKTKAIVVAAIDKPYPGEYDKTGLKEWEQNPPSDLDKAFDVRYILKTY